MVSIIKDKECRHSCLLYFFVFAVLVLNSLIIGPFSLRVYATVIVMVYLILRINSFSSITVLPISSAYIKLYLAFLIIQLVCLVFNGELLEYEYFRRFLAYHLVCLVAFYAIYQGVNTRQQLFNIAMILVGIIFINSVFTLLQALGNPIAWDLALKFSPIEEAETQAGKYDSITRMGSLIPGIFGGVVRNAYYISSIAPLSMMFFNHKNLFIRYLAISISIVSLLAIFITQQRAGFYLYIAVFILLLFVTFVRKPILLLIPIVVSIFLSTQLLAIFHDLDLGRLVNMDNSDRSGAWNIAKEFIPTHILFGAPMEFQRLTGYSTHNIFFDSIIFSGIGGFIVLMTFIYKIGILCVKNTFKYMIRKCSLMTFSLAMSMTSCTLYGFTHNTSVLTGEVIIFILLSLFLKSIQLDRINSYI